MTRREKSRANKERHASRRRAGFTDQREIGRFQRGPGIVIIGSLVKLGGEPRADLRTFIQKDGRETPTRMGLCVPVAVLTKLRELLQQVTEAAAARSTEGQSPQQDAADSGVE